MCLQLFVEEEVDSVEEGAGLPAPSSLVVAEAEAFLVQHRTYLGEVEHSASEGVVDLRGEGLTRILGVDGAEVEVEVLTPTTDSVAIDVVSDGVGLQ